MAEIVLNGTLKADGSLELSQPINLPPGQVRVVVQTAVSPSEPKKGVLAVLERIWAERRALASKGRSKAQIDTDIQAMRQEWEREPGEIQRDRAEAGEDAE